MDKAGLNIKERISALEILRHQKLLQAQELENSKNEVLTEIVKIQGKLEILKEMDLALDANTEKQEIEEKV